MKALSGYKTYVFTALAAITGILWGLGIIDEAAAKVLLGVFGGGGLFSLRAGIKKVADKPTEETK